METTATDGKKYQTTFYRIEAVLAVGYRVNSAQGYTVSDLGNQYT